MPAPPPGDDGSDDGSGVLPARTSATTFTVLRALREVFVVTASAATVFVSAAGALTGAVRARDVTLAVGLTIAVVVLLLVRRSRPLTASLATTALYVLDGDVVIAALVALGSLAVRGSRRRTAVGAAAALAALVVRQTRYGSRVDALWEEPGGLAVGVLGIALVTCAGLYTGARRDLLQVAIEQARRARAEQELRAEQARNRERARIAREMHDVLAHRLSMLSLHAAALEYRQDLSSSAVAEAAAVIRDNAHEALQDLRDVLGVLRAQPPGATAAGAHRPDGEAVAQEEGEAAAGGLRPAPTLHRLPGLVEEAAGLGTEVTLNVTGDPSPSPGAADRAAYRVVQEGLTNARKHAPGGHVVVDVDVDDARIAVRVRNAPASRPPAPATSPAAALASAGSGNGLTGVVERADLLGGWARYGPTAEGGFEVEAHLPRRPPGDAGPG